MLGGVPWMLHFTALPWPAAGVCNRMVEVRTLSRCDPMSLVWLLSGWAGGRTHHHHHHITRWPYYGNICASIANLQQALAR